MTVRLDTRPARQDLTSRECAKILSAVVASARMTRARMDLLRELVRLSGKLDAALARRQAELTELVAAERREHPAAYEALVTCAALVGGLLGGLADQSHAQTLEDAVDWVVNQDAIWTGAAEAN